MSKRKNDNDAFRQILKDIQFKGVYDVNGKHHDFNSTQAFADYLKVSRQTLGFWLKGERTPDMDYLVKISKALNMSIDYLVGIAPSNSLDADVQSAVRYTGLTEETIKALSNQFDGLGAKFINGFVASGYYESFMLDMCKALAIATSDSDNDAPIFGDGKPRFGKGKLDNLDLSTNKRDFLRLYANEIGHSIGEHLKNVFISVADDVQRADIEYLKKQIEELKEALRDDEEV